MTLLRSISLLLLILVLDACSHQQEPAAPAGSTKIAILLAPSGRGDRSYNDMALGGVTDARTKLPQISVTEILPPKPADYEPIIRKLAAAGTDLIVGVGFLYT